MDALVNVLHVKTILPGKLMLPELVVVRVNVPLFMQLTVIGRVFVFWGTLISTHTILIGEITVAGSVVGVGVVIGSIIGVVLLLAQLMVNDDAHVTVGTIEVAVTWVELAPLQKNEAVGKEVDG